MGSVGAGRARGRRVVAGSCPSGAWWLGRVVGTHEPGHPRTISIGFMLPAIDAEKLARDVKASGAPDRSAYLRELIKDARKGRRKVKARPRLDRAALMLIVNRIENTTGAEQLKWLDAATRTLEQSMP